MYVLACPCILDPSLRAQGITSEADRNAFDRAIERCHTFGVDIVAFPCPETLYLGRNRSPTTFREGLDTPQFSLLLDRLEAEVREIMQCRGPPLCIIGVDSSPSCGVDFTYIGSRGNEPPKVMGRGAFLARFPEVRALDVKTFARYRVYIAAPLFSEAERAYNRALRDLLAEHLFSVFLPQENGDTDICHRDLEATRAIFSFNLKALRSSDLVVAVCDGADADSGTAWEIGYAYAIGIPVVAVRSDFRMAGTHERVNLMLEESALFVTGKEELPAAIRSPFAG
jgi:nucleoside 2-deoxyribosyltransferase/predicted secreted protein